MSGVSTPLPVGSPSRAAAEEWAADWDDGSEPCPDQPQNLPDAPLGSPVKNKPGRNPGLNGMTFLVTISPRDDVSEKCENALLKWIDRNTLYAYVVFEHGKSGKKHMHAALCFAEPRSKQRLQEDLWKFKVKKWHGDSIGKYAVVVTNMYNHDWYDEYLKKEEGVIVLRDAYPRSEFESRFPTAEQQQLFRELQGKRIADTVVHDHCLSWEATVHPLSLEGSLRYLRERMFIKRDMMVIQDERRVRQMALALYRYRSGNIEKSAEDDEWLARHEPRSLTYEVPITPYELISRPVGINSGGAQPVFKGGRVT